MLGWVLRKGLEGASGRDKATDPDDTTNVEQPDTPAPVFAARALKSAIFGTPGVPDDPTVETVTMVHDDNNTSASRTPQKPPQGILLTPGTGTSRRKRVSFDHQTVDRGDDAQGRARRRREGSRMSKLFGSQKNNGSNTKRSRTVDTANTRESKPVIPSTQNQLSETKPQVDSGDEEWEEDDGDHCMHDITVDLNEPFSRSGQYWKAEFENYHADAKFQMEKLIKYKQLAKSYAKAKDAEAIDLSGKLKEERQKIDKMERQIAEMAIQVDSKCRAGEGGDNTDLMKDLAKQTALAVQYRSQVEDLEALLEDKLEGDEPAGARRRRQLASPRTQKTLLETQRELRRARAQVKENGDLKEQVKQLKAELRALEDRASKVTDTGKKDRLDRLSTDYSKELEALRRENDRLKGELESLKTEAAQKDEDTKQVLEKATNKIADLKKEIRTLKASSANSGTEVRAIVNKSTEPARKLRRLSDHGPRRSTSDNNTKEESKSGMDLVASLGKKLNENAPRTLRSQYKENEMGPTSFEHIGKPVEDKATPPGTPVPSKASGNIVENRVELEKPKWKPFIPRSPRNRDRLGTDLNQFLKQSSAVPTGQTPAPPRHRPKEKDFPHIDLLQDQFSRLGVPQFETSTMLAKSSLPPERRAAAIARIERRKAERKKMMDSVLMGKENVAP